MTIEATALDQPPVAQEPPPADGVSPPPAAAGHGRTLFVCALLAITLVAGLLRFTALEAIPAGLFRDEAEKGYNAWAMATSGGMLDFTGGVGEGPPVYFHPWPWMLNVMGSRTSAIYQYLSVPFMLAGGLTVATTRMAAALAGTLAVLLLGLLAARAWGRPPGLACALWLALSPWHLVFSRWALQGILTPLLLIVALIGLQGIVQRRRWGWPLLGAGLGWLFYAYSGAQPFVLAWGCSLLLILLLNKRIALNDPAPYLGLALFLVPVVPTLLVTFAPGGGYRMSQIAAWGEPNLSPLQIAQRIFTNYLRHLDPRFLFAHGDANPRHCVPGLGQMLGIDALLIPVGFIWMLRRRSPLFWPLVAALLCAPLPAAITRVGIPHALRAMPMLVPLVIWSGCGLAAIGAWLHGRFENSFDPRGARIRANIYTTAFLATCLIVALGGVHLYFRQYAGSPVIQVAFEAGQRDAWRTLSRERRPGERVWINGYIPYVPYFQLFYLQLKPRQAVAERLLDREFIYFDPMQMNDGMLAGRVAPGDWLLQPISAEDFSGAGRPPGWISAEEASRGGEIWVMLLRQPPKN